MAQRALSPTAKSQSFDFPLFPTALVPNNTFNCRAIFAQNEWAINLLASQFPNLFEPALTGVTFSSIGLSGLDFTGTTVTAPFPLDAQALAMQFYTSLYTFQSNFVRSKFTRTAPGLGFGNQRIDQYRVAGSQINLVNRFDLISFINSDDFQTNIVETAGLWTLDPESIFVIESPAQAGPVIPNFHNLTVKFELQNEPYVSEGQLWANGVATGQESVNFALGAARS